MRQHNGTRQRLTHQRHQRRIAHTHPVFHFSICILQFAIRTLQSLPHVLAPSHPCVEIAPSSFRAVPCIPWFQPPVFHFSFCNSQYAICNVPPSPNLKSQICPLKSRFAPLTRKTPPRDAEPKTQATDETAPAAAPLDPRTAETTPPAHDSKTPASTPPKSPAETPHQT